MVRLDSLDEILILSEGQSRSLDCVLAFELENLPSIQQLNAGALKAQSLFPKTSSHEIEIRSETDLETFANRPLKSHWHIEEAIIGKTLALKMSHVLGDAVSMILFLKAQLGEEVTPKPIELHQFKSKKNTPYKSMLPSSAWGDGSGDKRIIAHCELLHEAQYGEFSVNDLLSLALLRSLDHSRKALWIPVNVRKDPWNGFGNGLSRIRLYPLDKKNASIAEELKFLRLQKKEAWSSGELFLPSPDFKLDSFLKKSLLRLWINRPWADWGTISFSHIHDKDGQLPGNIRKAWGITNIPAKLHAGLFALTINDRTFVTIVAENSVDKKTLDDLLKRLGDNFEIIKSSL